MTEPLRINIPVLWCIFPFEGLPEPSPTSWPPPRSPTPAPTCSARTHLMSAFLSKRFRDAQECPLFSYLELSCCSTADRSREPYASSVQCLRMLRTAST
jgi:hypothetical protein